MRILVTGGAGFIGCNLIETLLNNGANIVVYDNLTDSSPTFIGLKSKVSLIMGDILDEKNISSAVAGMDAVIHLAAKGSVVDSVLEPTSNFTSNVIGTFNVLKACKTANVKNIVLASTGGALIGNSLPPVSESSIPRPISPYGASKLCGEAYASAFSHAYNLNITCLRFANIYGPHSLHKKGIVTNYLKSIIGGEPLKVYGDGKATRDYLYVKDLCEGIYRALINNNTGLSIYHLASGVETSVIELGEMIFNLVNIFKKEYVYLPERAGEVDRNFADFALAKEKIGFQPSMSLADGIEITLKWYRDNYIR